MTCDLGLVLINLGIFCFFLGNLFVLLDIEKKLDKVLEERKNA